MVSSDSSGNIRPPHPLLCDPVLLSALTGLILLGLVMVASASLNPAQLKYGQALFFFWKQLVFTVLGVAAAFLLVRVSTTVWQRFNVSFLLLGGTLLVLVLIPGIGHEVNGSMRWLHAGGFNFQPSELMKPLMVLYLAGYLVRRGTEVRTGLSGALKPLVLLVLVTALLLLEPDYGASVVLFATVLGMLFSAGVPLRQFVLWVVIVVTALGGVILMAPYRMQRLTTFMDPWADPFNSGFQLTQALIAIGRGEWFGTGLGNSIQKLTYLPEAHTDFLFAIIAEELGLAGGLLVIALCAVIFVRSLAIARKAAQQQRFYAAYTACGMGLCLGVQSLINLGVNMGLLPTKGLTLPFVSYGGSSILVSCFMAALLFRIAYENRCTEAGNKF